jgi:hypothetical protein
MLRTLALMGALAGCTAATNAPTPLPDLAPPPDLAALPDLTQPPSDLTSPPDLGPVDLGPDLARVRHAPAAAPWISSGGGSATAGGRQLNITVGAHGGAGRSVTIGRTLTFGPFSTQTY